MWDLIRWTKRTRGATRNGFYLYQPVETFGAVYDTVFCNNYTRLITKAVKRERLSSEYFVQGDVFKAGDTMRNPCWGLIDPQIYRITDSHTKGKTFSKRVSLLGQTRNLKQNDRRGPTTELILGNAALDGRTNHAS